MWLLGWVLRYMRWYSLLYFLLTWQCGKQWKFMQLENTLVTFEIFPTLKQTYHSVLTFIILILSLNQQIFSRAVVSDLFDTSYFFSFHQGINESVETPTHLWLHCRGMYFSAIQGHNIDDDKLEVREVAFWLERCQFESVDCLGKCERGSWCNTFTPPAAAMTFLLSKAHNCYGWSRHCSSGDSRRHH